MRSALSRHSSRAVGWKGGMWPCSGCSRLASERYAQQIHQHVVVVMQNIDSQRTKGKRASSSRYRSYEHDDVAALAALVVERSNTYSLTHSLAVSLSLSSPVARPSSGSRSLPARSRPLTTTFGGGVGTRPPLARSLPDRQTALLCHPSAFALVRRALCLCSAPPSPFLRCPCPHSVSSVLLYQAKLHIFSCACSGNPSPREQVRDDEIGRFAHPAITSGELAAHTRSSQHILSIIWPC